MALTSITRYPGGVNAQRADGPHADLRVPFVGNYAQFFDDFMPYTAGNYVVTGTGTIAQAAAAAMANENGIALVTTPAGGGEQALQSQSTTLPFAALATKEAFVGARIQLDDITLGGFFIGLTGAATAPIGTPPSDGIYFTKNSNGNPTVGLRAGGNTIAQASMVFTPSNAVWYTVGLSYSPVDAVLRGFMSAMGAGPNTPAASCSVAMPAGATFPSVGLSPNFSAIGTAAGARVCMLDYIWAAKSR